jgi:hypothetical protein
VGGLILNIEEGYAGALTGELGDEGFADAGGAAGDEDYAVLQAGVGGVLGICHGRDFRSGYVIKGSESAPLRGIASQQVSGFVWSAGEFRRERKVNSRHQRSHACAKSAHEWSTVPEPASQNGFPIGINGIPGHCCWF